MFRFSRDIRYPSLNYRADLQELKSGELILYRAVKMFRFSRDIRYPSLNYRADLQELKSGELILHRAVKMFRFSRDVRYPSLTISSVSCPSLPNNPLVRFVDLSLYLSLRIKNQF